MYDDIIDIDYPFDLGYSRMSIENRCSQFMPFSALAGYSDAVNETARITDCKIILDEEMKDILDNKINLIISKLSLKPIVSIIYFISDKTKSGGSYKSVTGVIKKIDLYKNLIIINDLKISIDDIVDITSNIFDDIFK